MCTVPLSDLCCTSHCVGVQRFQQIRLYRRERGRRQNVGRKEAPAGPPGWRSVGILSQSVLTIESGKRKGSPVHHTTNVRAAAACASTQWCLHTWFEGQLISHDGVGRGMQGGVCPAPRSHSLRGLQSPRQIKGLQFGFAWDRAVGC